METQELTEILEAAVGQIPPPPSPWAIPFPGPGVLEVLVRDPDGQALQETLMKAEGLELFDDTTQVVGSGGTTFDRVKLAIWLLDRGKDVGAERAVSDLQTYLESSTFRAFHVMVLVGQAVEECNEIGEDIWLVKWSELPIKWLRDWMWTIIRSPLPSRTPSAAIIQPFEHKKIHHPRNAHDHPPFFHRSIDHLEAARLCIPLMEERSAELLCHGIIPAGEVPYSGGFSWSVDADKWHKVASKITPIETARARELHGAFTSLKPDEQKRLGISLERLSSFNSRKNDVQGAIDLRVAMEAVFLADKGPELSFRTAVRAAAFLGGSYETRKAVFADVKLAYSLGSDAVHAGKFSKDNKKKDPEGTLKRAAEVTRGAIEKMLIEGSAAPDWTRLILSPGEGSDGDPNSS